MSLHDFYLLLLGAFFEIAAVGVIVFGPELLDCLLSLGGNDSWPGEH
jgi:hypothetical protein